jgi:hypothetical protein
MSEEKKETIVLDKDGQEVKLKAIITSVINKLNKKDAIENSKGKVVISDFLDILIENGDPFVKALGVLGNEQTINALGLLLFVTFQLGVNFGSGSCSFADEVEK